VCRQSLKRAVVIERGDHGDASGEMAQGVTKLRGGEAGSLFDCRRGFQRGHGISRGSDEFHLLHAAASAGKVLACQARRAGKTCSLSIFMLRRVSSNGRPHHELWKMISSMRVSV